MLPIRAVAAVLAALMMITSAASGQEAEWPGYAVVRNTIVEAGKWSDYEAFLKEIAKADATAQASTTRIVESGMISPGGLYTTISFHTDFTDLALQGSFAKIHGDAAWEKRIARLGGVISNTERKIYYRRPDLGREDPELDSGKVEIWYTYHVDVRTGANAQFESWMQKLVDATDKVAPDAYWYTYAPWLNTGNVYRITVPLTLARLNQPVMSPVQRIEAAFSKEEAARLADLNTASVLSVDMTLLQNRPDLSYFAPAP